MLELSWWALVVRSVGGARGVTMCQQVGGTKGVRSVGSAMVSCVAMVSEISLGVRSRWS